MDRLYRIFNELHIPCYLLFDYDKNNTKTDIINKSKELLALAGEGQEAPQVILIADDVACFPNTWETDLKPEISDSESLAALAREELGFSGTSDSKPLIARFTARVLTSRNPAVIPPSLEKIVKKAVQVLWKQSCLKAPSDTTPLAA